MLIEQAIDLRKVRTENLEIWTNFQNQVMDGWSATKLMIIFSSILLKKIFK